MRAIDLRRRPVALVAAIALAASAVAALAVESSANGLADNHKGGSLGISSKPWGTFDGQQVDLYTLSSGRDMTVDITNFGAVVQSIRVPDRAGRATDVALGFPTLSDYVNDFLQQHTGVPWPLPGGSGDTYFGATIGRYANRIADHSFTMTCTDCSNNGVTYTLPANNGTATLHGGDLGWNTKVWTATPQKGPGFVALKLALTSPDGDEGFPASVTTTVTYTVTDRNELQIRYGATNNEPSGGKATVVNLTNHTYFNLAGEGSGPVFDQRLALNADKYSPIDTNFIPTQPFTLPVTGTPFDFRTIKPIGKDITDLTKPDGTAGTPTGTNGTFKQLVIAHGYDHNWVLNGSGMRLAAVAQDPGNGVTLWTYTDQPGVQVYSGNFLVGDLTGPSGHTYRQTSAFTLETQHFPDTPHHIGQAGWPSVVLNAGNTFTSMTTYRFTTEGRGLHVSF
jgi:aldose 1-epimerase